jgi:hypothetical protein
VTKSYSRFPLAEPTGEDLANFSAYRIYERSAIAGYGVLDGCVVTRTSATEVAVSSGNFTISGVRASFAGASLSGISAASVGYHRYDLVYIDGTDSTQKIEAGVEEVPDSSIDFLENYHPRPAEPTDTDWIVLAVIRVTENGIEDADFGTVVYAQDSIADMRLSPAFAVDDVTLQVINGVASVKASAGHASTHKTGGSDSIKLDEFASPEDNTNLNVSALAHGLCPKIPNNTTTFLRGDGTYAAPSVSAHASTHASGQSDAIKIDDLAAGDDNTDLNVSTTKHGLCPKLSNSATQALLGNGTYGNPAPAAHATSHKTGGSDSIKLDELASPTDVTTLNVSTSVHGLCPKAPAVATQFLNGLSGGWTVPNVSVYGPYRITHDGGSSQAILTTSALCEIDEIVVKCQQAGASRTVDIGWAANTNALMTDSEVPHILNGTTFIRNPIAEITSATALIATVGGSGDGEWDIWLKISRYE